MRPRTSTCGSDNSTPAVNLLNENPTLVALGKKFPGLVAMAVGIPNLSTTDLRRSVEGVIQTSSDMKKNAKHQ